MKKFLLEEDGVTSIEYALLASLIAMVVLVGIIALKGSVLSMYEYVSTEVVTALKRG